MEVTLIKEKLLNHKEIPEAIKNAILQSASKIDAFSIPSERIIHIYKIRMEINKDNEAYKEINFETEKVLSFLRDNDQKMATIISVQSQTIDAGIFTDENIDRILGILNFTGLGNRFYVLNPEDS